MITHFKKYKYFILAILSCLPILIADSFTPQGVDVWILYIIPILIVFKSENMIAIYVLLGICAFFIGFGLYLSPSGIPIFLEIESRVFGFFSDFILAVIIGKLIQTRKQLKVESEHLKQRTQELVFANKELEAFSYSVSHDLRSPVSVIKSFAQLLIEDHSENLNSEGQDYLRRIVINSDQMQSLISDILNLFKVSRENLKLSPTDLSAIGNRIAENLKKSEPDRKVVFKIDERMIAMTDERLMEIALTNIIGNAWKYTSNSSDATIEFRCKKENEKTIFFIRDNGTGFDMKYVSDIFQPFKRLHSDKEFKGTGVGLAIVDRIITKHGGTIWAEGEVGKGAVVYFTLKNNNLPI